MNKDFFTPEQYEAFCKGRSTIINQIYRDEGQSFSDVMRSDESDFTKTKEGQEALDAIVAFGNEING